jgi:hypothetical protein
MQSFIQRSSVKVNSTYVDGIIEDLDVAAQLLIIYSEFISQILKYNGEVHQLYI